MPDDIMTEPAPDAAVTAWLAQQRKQDEAVAMGEVRDPELVRKLLRGYEDLLTQAARWDEEAKALYARAKDFHDVRGVHLMVRAEATALRPGELRDVIAASLLGEDGS